MIGDTSFDMQMARQAGMSGFGVSWGYHPTQALTDAGAAQIFGDFVSLTQAIEEWSA
jgi:phosphoglycolate phosphatase